jgi:metacaspase-1
MKTPGSRIAERRWRPAASSLFLAALCLSAVAFGQAPGPRKYALIIAIGDYPAQNGWPKISSIQDVPYLEKTLQDQGFADKDIAVLRDSAATMEGIRAAFAAMTAKARRGDIVVVHFSSHGEQVEADNDNKIDGLDECVVTYNAISPLQSKDYYKDQAQYLRGHVLGSYLRTLRAKLGTPGDLIVFMDNCHSGDGTRGLAKIRGGGPPFLSPDWDPGRHVRSDSSMVSRDEASYSVNGADLASYEVFSATRPEELDFEMTDEKTGVGMGSLTYAICQSFEGLSTAGDGGGMPTYRELFARIESVMNIKVPNQHPLLEGNGSNRLLFGGKFVRQQPYIGIAAIDRSKRKITLQQGVMAGLDQGARIAVYPASTRDTTGKKPLCRGTISLANAFSAVAALDADIPFSQPADGLVFVTERVYKVDPVRLRLHVGARDAAIRQLLADDAVVTVVDSNSDLTLFGDTLKVSGNGYVFGFAGAGELKDKLEAYARYKFLQSLSSTVFGLKAEVGLVLLKNGKPDSAATALRMRNGRLETYDGDSLTLWIKNTGRKDEYVNIIDLQPDGLIGPVVSNKQMGIPIEAHNLKLSPGQVDPLPTLDYVGIQPPCGTEVYKIFVSPVQIDVQDLANTRGGGNGVMQTIEKMVRGSFSLSRGGQTYSMPNADVTTSEYIFLIKPKP